MISQRLSTRKCFFLWTMIFILDRVSKLFVINRLNTDWTINSFLKFHKIFNHGISWGVLHDATPFIYFMISGTITLILSALGVYALIRWLDNRLIIGELLILAGGLSNLIDRLWYGAVVDFILCSWNTWSFPIFNVADIAIVIGVAIMFYDSWYNK